MPEPSVLINASARVAPVEVRHVRPRPSLAAADLLRGAAQRGGPEYQRWVYDPDGGPLRGRWLYVFAVLLSGDAFAAVMARIDAGEDDPLLGLGETEATAGELVAEVMVDAEGRLFPVDASHHGKPSHERRLPDPAVDASRDSLVLDYMVGTRVALHVFFASPFRLSSGAIARLARALPRRVPCVPVCLGVPDALPRIQRGGQRLLGVPALDPLAVGAGLTRAFHEARDEALSEGALLTSRGAEAPEKEQARVLEYLLARGLHDVIGALGSTSSKASKLRGLMTDDGRKRWRGAIRRFEARAKKLAGASDQAAAAVCAWLETPLWRAYEEAVVEVDREQEAAGVPLGEREVAYFLAQYAETIDRLDESAPGMAYLRRVAERTLEAQERAQPDLLDRYVLDPPLSWKDHFKAGRYSSKAFFKTFSQLLKARVDALKARGNVAASEVTASAVKAINAVHGEELVRAGPVISRRAFLRGRLKGGRPGVATVEVRPVEVVDPARLEKARLHIGDFLGALDVINVFVSVYAAVEATEGKGRKTLDAAAAVAGAAKSIIEQVGKRQGVKTDALFSVRALSAITSSYYVVVNIADQAKLRERGDYDAMLAKSAAAIAEALVVRAALLALPGLGTVGGILAAAAYVAAYYLTDDDLDLLVGYSVWGEHFGDTSFFANDKPHRWVAGTFRLADWDPARGLVTKRSRSLDLQLRSFHALNSAFDLSFGRKAAVQLSTGDFTVSPLPTLRIQHGQLGEGSRFTVAWVWQAAGSPRREAAVTFSAEDAVEDFRLDGVYVGPSRLHGSAVHGVLWTPDERRFEVSPPQAALDLLTRGLSSLTALVSLDLMGDGRMVLPADTVLTVSFMQQGRQMFDQVASSKRFPE